MKSWEQNERIRERVEKDWDDDIEENIKQMHFIEQLACNEIFEELNDRIKIVLYKKLFLDKLRISIEEDQFKKFISLYSFPSMLHIRVFTQFENLKETTRKISSKITERVDEAESRIEEFYIRFNVFYDAKVETTADLRARTTP